MVASKSNARRLPLFTLNPSGRVSTEAPLPRTTSRIRLSACSESGLRPVTVSVPNIAAVTIKLAAALQSPSKVISVGVYFCLPGILNTNSSSSRCQSSFMPNFSITSTVSRMYGTLVACWTRRTLSFLESGRAISRPEMNCEPFLPDIVISPPFIGPLTTAGRVSSAVRMQLAPSSSIASLQPYICLSSRLPSPVTVTDSPNWATTGMHRRDSSPDSPTNAVRPP